MRRWYSFSFVPISQSAVLIQNLIRVGRPIRDSKVWVLYVFFRLNVSVSCRVWLYHEVAMRPLASASAAFRTRTILRRTGRTCIRELCGNGMCGTAFSLFEARCLSVVLHTEKKTRALRATSTKSKRDSRTRYVELWCKEQGKLGRKPSAASVSLVRLARILVYEPSTSKRSVNYACCQSSSFLVSDFCHVPFFFS